MKNLKEKRETLLQTIQNYCDTHPVSIDFDCRETYDKEAIKKIIEKGKDSFFDDLYELNIDYICQEEDYFKKEILVDIFKDDITEILLQEYTQEQIDQDNLILDFMSEIYPTVNMNVDQILNNTQVNGIFSVYSNYDCTVSYDTMDDENYLSEVYKLVKNGIDKESYLWEHSQSYGGSLFIFPFTTSLNDFLELKEKFKTAKNITIPENTVFGFYSSHQGSASPLEKTTTKKMTLPIKYGKTKYDDIGLKADVENYYSLNDIFGGITFPDPDFILN